MVDVCPRTSSPEGCRYALPMIWPVMAPQLMGDFSDEFCPYLDCDTSSTVPPCDECIATLSMAGNALRTDLLINHYIEMFAQGDWCKLNWPDYEESCQGSLTEWLPLILSYIADSPRDWVDAACTTWECEPNIAWTCDKCQQMSETTASDSIFLGRWTSLLIRDICPVSSNTTTCDFTVPMFWPILAPQFMVDFSKEFCPYLDCDPTLKSPFTKATVPPCDECIAALSDAGDALKTQRLIDHYMAMFAQGDWCQQNWPGFDQQCQEGLSELLPEILAYIADSPRDWVDAACTTWGCEERDVDPPNSASSTIP